MRELARAGLGEIDAVIGAQPADLALKIRALLQIAAGFVDKSIPDIDIGDAGLAGGIAIQRIQEQHVRRSLRTAYRGQADPHHRHAFGFQHRDHLFDLLAVELDPAFLAELIEAVRRARALFRRDRRRGIVGGGVIGRQFAVHRFVVGLGAGLGIRLRSVRGLGLRFGLGFGAGIFLVVLLVGFLGRRLVDRDAVVEPEHDNDGFRFLGGENGLGGGGPVGRLAPRLIFDQSGIGLVPADDADLGLVGIGILEAVGKPVRHGVTQHQHIALRHGVAFFRRRSSGKVLADHPPWRLLLERGEQVAAEPAAAAARLRPRRPAEIEKELRRRRPGNPDQQRHRHRQRDPRAAFGEHPEKGLRTGHAHRSELEIR